MNFIDTITKIRHNDYFVSVEDPRTGERTVVVARTWEGMRKRVLKLADTDARFDGVQVYRQFGNGADAFAEKCGIIG